MDLSKEQRHGPDEERWREERPTAKAIELEDLQDLQKLDLTFLYRTTSHYTDNILKRCTLLINRVKKP